MIQRRVKKSPIENPTDLAGRNCLVHGYKGAGQDLWAHKTDAQEEHIQVSASLSGNELDIFRQAPLSDLRVA